MQEKGFNFKNPTRLQKAKKYETFCVFKLLIWRQKYNGPPVFGMVTGSLVACRVSAGKM